MQRVFVLDTNRQPLMPTRPARARKMLSSGQAAVYRHYPFTIILKRVVDTPQGQPTEMKLDPGSKTSGMSIVAQFARGWVLLWAAELHHRGQLIKKGLEKRRGIRRGRRTRKTRYRKPRFSNRTRPKGWLAPSLRSRVDNVAHWAQKLTGCAPITAIQAEVVRFDTQKTVNPEINGVEYQQGELAGYEVREYLLEKWGRKCAYCKVENVPLQIEHIVPKSRGGSNRASNLTIACVDCNQTKGNRTAKEFGHPKIQAQALQPLRDAAAINSIRWAIGDKLKALGLPVGFWSGGRTKYNRIRQGYAKSHWIDALCVGETGAGVYVPRAVRPLQIKAAGRGNRRRAMIDKYGFPRVNKSGQLSVKLNQKRVHGFQTGDMVKAVIPAGKYAGIHVGRVSIRVTGNFQVGHISSVNWRHCKLLQRSDGYNYASQNL